jgi:hypothetical protein
MLLGSIIIMAPAMSRIFYTPAGTSGPATAIARKLYPASSTTTRGTAMRTKPLSTWTAANALGLGLGFPAVLQTGFLIQFGLRTELHWTPQALGQGVSIYARLVGLLVGGAILGAAQALVLRSRPVPVVPWIPSTATGFGLVVAVMWPLWAAGLWGQIPGPVEPILITVGGGSLAGVLQYLLLRREGVIATRWLALWVGGLEKQRRLGGDEAAEANGHDPEEELKDRQRRGRFLVLGLRGGSRIHGTPSGRVWRGGLGSSLRVLASKRVEMRHRFSSRPCGGSAAPTLPSPTRPAAYRRASRPHAMAHLEAFRRMVLAEERY